MALKYYVRSDIEGNGANTMNGCLAKVLSFSRIDLLYSK